MTGVHLIDKGRELGIVLKTSERCNIACTYCYFFFKGDDTYKQHPPLLVSDVASDVVETIRKLVVDLDITTLSVGLHGGEPLMAKKAVIDQLCGSIRELTKETPLKEVLFNVQTNGMLIDDDWLEIFLRHEIGVGISLDGPAKDNDEQRLDKRGRGTYQRAIAGYRKVYEAAHEGRTPLPGLLCVIDPTRDGAATYRHFRKDLHCRTMNFLLPDVRYDDAVVDQDYIAGIEAFLLDVFRAWVAEDDPDVSVRFINEALKPMRSEAMAQAMCQEIREYRHLLTISSDGTVGFEDTLKPLDPRFQPTFVLRDQAHAADHWRHEVMEELSVARHTPPPVCSTCDFWGICRGGNVVNRYSGENGFANESVFCSALKSLYIDVAAWLVENDHRLDDIDARLRFARAH